MSLKAIEAVFDGPYGAFLSTVTGAIVTIIVACIFGYLTKCGINKSTEKMVATTEIAKEFTSNSLASIANFISIKWGTERVDLKTNDNGVFVDVKTGEEFTITVTETAKVDK